MFAEGVAPGTVGRALLTSFVLGEEVRRCSVWGCGKQFSVVACRLRPGAGLGKGQSHQAHCPRDKARAWEPMTLLSQPPSSPTSDQVLMAASSGPSESHPANWGVSHRDPPPIPSDFLSSQLTK